MGTDVTIEPAARRPLRLEMPLLISDMSFGAISEEAAVALGRGAEIAGTGICSGEGRMLPGVRDASSRYLYELAPGRFGWEPEIAEASRPRTSSSGRARRPAPAATFRARR